MNIDIGDTVHVSEAYEAKTERGVLVARFLPGFGYKVTMGNRLHFLAASENGIVSKGAPPGSGAGMSVARVRGKVTTKEGGKS